MVNTFITSKCYKESASYLDKKRLWKQCLEAKQILDILEQLEFIAKRNNYPERPAISDDIATQFLKSAEWVKDIRKKYLASKECYVCIDNEWSLRNMDDLPHKIRKEKWSILPNGKVAVCISEKTKLSGPFASEKRRVISEKKFQQKHGDLFGKSRTPRNVFIFKRKEIALPEDKIYRLGFSQHPIVRMWCGYEDALRLYICDHLDECKYRGIKADSIKVKRPEGAVVHPWWINLVINSHRASLVRKELSRKEARWYMDNPLFFETSREWIISGYIWPCNLSHSDIAEIINGTSDPENHTKFCIAINSSAESPENILHLL